MSAVVIVTPGVLPADSTALESDGGFVEPSAALEDEAGASAAVVVGAADPSRDADEAAELVACAAGVVVVPAQAVAGIAINAIRASERRIPHRNATGSSSLLLRHRRNRTEANRPRYVTGGSGSWAALSKPRTRFKRPGYASSPAGNVARVLAVNFPLPNRIDATLEQRELNGEPGAILRDRDGNVVAAMAIDVLGGLIQTINAIVNPEAGAHRYRRRRLGGQS